MPDCYIIGRASGTRYGEKPPERDPCGVPDGALIYETECQPQPEVDEPVFVRD